MHTTEERQKLPRMRRGGQQLVVDIAGIADRHGITLVNITPDRVRAQLEVGQKFAVLKAEATAVRTTIADTARQAYAEAWDGALSLYQGLDRVSAGNAELLEALRPIRKFLSRGKKNGTAPAEKIGASPPVAEPTK